MLLRFLALGLVLWSAAQGANILGVFPHIGYSQYILASTLMNELLNRGHNVTVISAYSQKKETQNFTEVLITNFTEASYRPNLYQRESTNIFRTIQLNFNTGYSATQRTLQHENVHRLLKSNTTFNLVVCEIIMDEALMALAHHFNAPLVLFSSVDASTWTNHLVGNPSPYSYVPHLYSEYHTRMSFWERLRNTAMYMFDDAYKQVVSLPQQNRLLKKYLPGAPELSSFVHNVALVLLNSDASVNEAVPFMPNMVSIGGFHVQPKPLTGEYQKLLDEASEGAVLFSMGSNLKSSDFSERQKRAVLNVFSKLKQRVIWKWEDKGLEGVPENVKLVKWLPQQDLLSHPNVRLFITHGGLLSTLETIYHGIPIVGIPIFGDQKMNMAKAVRQGYGIVVPFQKLTEDNLERAIKEVLDNPRYRKVAQHKSKILKDQLVPPLEKAMFWIEYVLRHGNCDHLRSAALELSWYQYFLLDVMAVVVLTLIGLFVLVGWLLKVVWRCGTGRLDGKKRWLGKVSEKEQ